MPYREGPPRERDTYLVAWERLRRYQTGYKIFCIVGVPPLVLLCILGVMGPHWMRYVGYLSVAALVVLGRAFWNPLATFTCPDCGCAFLLNTQGRRGPSVYPLARQCFRCGISIGTPRALAQRFLEPVPSYRREDERP